MKDPAAVITDLTKALTKHWAAWVVDEPTGWPRTYPIGTPARGDLETNYATTHRPVMQAWDRWGAQHVHLSCSLRYARRRVGRLLLNIPTHLDIYDLDTAAALAAEDWSITIARARHRRQILSDTLDLDLQPRLLQQTVALADTDFTLLCRTVDWFHHHDATGLTTRQVPIPGLDAKWLDKHTALVLALLDRDSLDLIDRPQRIDLTYLDQNWRARGNRMRDSLATDDTNATVAYPPDIIIITENKDSALFFPTLPRGIAVEGGGWAITHRITRHTWFQQCPRIVYWGDIDAHGYEILNKLRTEHSAVDSILMGPQTYDEYHQFGVRTDRRGNPISAQRKPLPNLTDSERVVYNRITDSEHSGPLRIEQERIPLQLAEQVVRSRTPRQPPD
ncbi:conserved hypothetical protein (plasmid) [Rhodococcus jostii RHA1]|uniref:Wadjet protein JetD C-terminal domain-containing protein n=1 Tax=Rhodococcus jostii (strain RHA1) TaxID=101510 RepID=Q0RX31_RHOJR|nr:DUF3322 and DUF2220 domain-containing protein [Rhodococcus jostii]ABH00155.1 conserved hypothetical protein [Rhodococcus jostii RHA1]